MTTDEKISWLRTHAPGPYARAREKVLTELDELTPVFCFCGALATGLHTACCRKFQERLKTKIVKELGDLITSDKL